jgi:hypothetical protein
MLKSMTHTPCIEKYDSYTLYSPLNPAVFDLSERWPALNKGMFQPLRPQKKPTQPFQLSRQLRVTWGFIFWGDARHPCSPVLCGVVQGPLYAG